MIYLIRHTTPDIEQGVCYGQLDVDLTSSFNVERDRILEKITPNSNIEVYSSPLKRCIKLAKSLFPFRPIEKDKRLMELDFGQWENKKWNKIDEQELRLWGDNFVSSKLHGGESFEELNWRVLEFWKSVYSKNTDTAIVTHSGVIRCILTHLLHMPLSKAFVLKIAYAEVIKIEIIDSDNCTVEFV